MKKTEREVVEKSSQNAKKELGYKALSNGCKQNAGDFLKQEKVINSHDNEGKTLMHRSIQEGRSDITMGLINLKADPNSEDLSGRTPLQYAIDKNSFEQIELLRKNNAVLRTRNAKGIAKSYRMVTADSSESEVSCKGEESEHTRLSTAASSSYLQDQIIETIETTVLEASDTEGKLLPNEHPKYIPSLLLNNINSINPSGNNTNKSDHHQPTQLVQALVTDRKFHRTILTVDPNSPTRNCLPDQGQVDTFPSASRSIVNSNHKVAPLSESEAFPENAVNATTLDSDKKNDSEQLAGQKDVNGSLIAAMATFNAESTGLESPSPTVVKQRCSCLPRFFPYCIKKPQ